MALRERSSAEGDEEQEACRSGSRVSESSCCLLNKNHVRTQLDPLRVADFFVVFFVIFVFSMSRVCMRVCSYAYELCL